MFEYIVHKFASETLQFRKFTGDECFSLSVVFKLSIEHLYMRMWSVCVSTVRIAQFECTGSPDVHYVVWCAVQLAANALFVEKG